MFAVVVYFTRFSTCRFRCGSLNSDVSEQFALAFWNVVRVICITVCCTFFLEVFYRRFSSEGGPSREKIGALVIGLSVAILVVLFAVIIINCFTLKIYLSERRGMQYLIFSHQFNSFVSNGLFILLEQ